MKKYILGLMICMSVMGTTTSFGKTNKSVTKNSPRTEVVCNQKKSTTCECKTCKEVEKKQQKKVQQKKQQTCNCRTCSFDKTQDKQKQNTKQQVKQNTKQQPVSWRNTCQQPVRK